MIVKLNAETFVDEKYGIIKNIYDLPTYYGLPRVHVKMAFGGQYNTAGFNASGAGITKESAENSAVGEYIERYSCLHPNNISTIKESIRKINPKIINETASDNINDYNWIEAQDMIEKSPIALPLDSVYLTYRSNGNQQWITTATGAACGNNLNECFWKGVAEIFERDAFQYTWRRQISCDNIIIDSSNELKLYFDKYIKSENIKFKLYKLDMDWEVPAVFGTAIFPNGGCVVAASVRPTWIDACKKTLLELTQSIIGYAPIIFNKNEQIEIGSFQNIKEYQDHSLLYFKDNMSEYLKFLDENNKTFTIPKNERKMNDNELVDFFINKIKSISKSVFFIDITSKEIINTNWKVGKAIIPSMLDIEPNFIRQLKSKRLNEIDYNLIKFKKRKDYELKNPQPIVPHPFP